MRQRADKAKKRVEETNKRLVALERRLEAAGIR